MATYRQVQTSFWQDSFVLDLTPEEKYFFIYLMTNSKTTQCGIYELPKRIIETETGYNRETVDKLLQRFIDYGKILYYDETKELMMLNWLKYNAINSPKVKACIVKELNNIKHTHFVDLFYTLCIRYGYGINTVPIDYGEEEEKEEEQEEEEQEEEEQEEKKEVKKKASPKVKRAEFVSMTDEEYAKLKTEFGEEDALRLVDILNSYKGANGKRYKSDYLAIRNWVVDRLKDEKRKTSGRGKPVMQDELPQSVKTQLAREKRNERTEKGLSFADWVKLKRAEGDMTEYTIQDFLCEVGGGS